MSLVFLLCFSLFIAMLYHPGEVSGQKSPIDDLTDHINQLTGLGERPDWSLDESGEMTRITYFTEYEGFKASKSIISDDGRMMCFQIGKSGDEVGA